MDIMDIFCLWWKTWDEIKCDMMRQIDQMRTKDVKRKWQMKTEGRAN